MPNLPTYLYLIRPRTCRPELNVAMVTNTSSPKCPIAPRNAPPVPAPDLAVPGVHDLEAEARAVAGESLDLLAEMADQHHDVAEALAPDQSQLMREKRLARDHVDEGFQNRLGEGPKTRGEPSGENGQGRQIHRVTTVVPSTSRWKNSSLNPALVMVRRRRRASSA